MIGDRRKFITMLIVPEFGRLKKWAASAGVSAQSHGELIKQPAVVEKMNGEVFGALKGLASFETPKKIALLEREFSVDLGELTPSMKVKRRVIDKNYKSLIDGLYEDGEG
jgi:long-chain acyl-CoA synthetase